MAVPKIPVSIFDNLICQHNQFNKELVVNQTYEVIAVDASQLPSPTGYSTYEYNSFVVPFKLRVLVKGIGPWLAYSQFKKHESKAKSKFRKSKE